MLFSSEQELEWFFKNPILFLNQFLNVAYGPKIHGLCKDKNDLNNLVESCLVKVGLDEVKDRLEDSGTHYLEDNNRDCA